MNALSFRACGRILWREAAEQYAFCIGIFAMLIMMQASLATMESFDMIPTPTVSFGFSMALFMTAIYAAASSALLLTAEVEAGTFTFQRTRPIGWLTYLSGKLSWTVSSSLLLGLVAWIETAVWQGVFPGARETSLAMGVCGVGIAEGMAWGLMASMWFRGPLRAVIAGIAMASFSAWVLSHAALHHGAVAVSMAYYNTAGLRLVVAVVVLASGIPLTRVWYRTGQPLRLVLLPRFLRGKVRVGAIAGQWDSCGQPCRGRAIRLLWQAWRQIRTPAVIYWGLCFATLTWAGLRYVAEIEDSNPFRGPDFAAFLGLTSFAFAVFSSLLAGCTFGADQKVRFLQLARDGVSPGEIWLSRLAMMGAVLLAPATILLGLSWFGPTSDELVFFRGLAVFLVVLGYVSVLVIGQACSMFVRSRIVALLAAPVMVGCFAIWIGLGVFWLGLGWKLGVVPLLLALLVGSRLLVGTRLRQDNSWRAMRAPALLVVAGVLVTYQALAHHRANEIRPYDSRYRADELLMALPPQMILETEKQRVPVSTGNASPREWMEQVLLAEGDETSVNVSRLIRGPWYENSLSVFDVSKVFHPTYADMLVGDAELNQTLREVASQPGIPEERLRVCIAFLEGWAGQRSRLADWLEADCMRDMSWLQYGAAEKRSDRYGFHDEPLPLRYRWLSFERARALRLLNRACRVATDRAEKYEKAVIDDQTGVGLHGPGLLTSQSIISPDPARPVWYQVSNQTLFESGGLDQFRLLKSLRTLRWGKVSWNGTGTLYMAESQRRGTILYLALRMYYNAHSELPKSLDALVEGMYLDRLPVVPIAREPFYYEPVRASDELNAAIRPPSTYEISLIVQDGRDISAFLEHDPTLPFLWCPIIPDHPMNPGVGPGFFIDLDFVKEKESE